MPPSYGTTAKHALRKLLGSNVVSDIDAGFGALADDLDGLIVAYSQGTLASRPTSTGGSPGKQGRVYRATDVGILFYDNGTGWDPVSTPPIVDALPSGATRFDGQEVFLQTSAMAALGIRWHLAYRAGASGSYKWEFLGGPPLLDEVDAISTAASAVADLAVTVPLAGDYLIDSGIRAQRAGGDFACELVVKGPAPATTTVTDQAWIAAGPVASGTPRHTGSGTCKKTLAAGDYKGDTVNLGNDPTVIAAWMKLTPVRVG